MAAASPPSPAPTARPAPPAPALAVLLAALSIVASCGYTEIRTQCPTCTVVSRDVDSQALGPDVRTVFLVVPGLLGFGWEWDQPMARLHQVPGAIVETFDWRPTSSAGRVGRDLAAHVDRLFAAAPALARVVVFGHSAGGLVTARAAAEVHVPAGRRVQIVNIGTPYAGMHTTPFDGPLDGWWAPLGLAIGGVLTRYPAPAPGVDVESWITPWPTDPVMKPRFGHHPDDPRVGPPGPRHRAPEGTDHNRFVAEVVEDVARRLMRASAIEAPPRSSLQSLRAPASGAPREPALASPARLSPSSKH